MIHDCDKIFRREGTLEKHIQAAHEDITLFCHYFNNEKDCPYEDECIFVHEESDNCKFGNGCERLLCMYDSVSASVRHGRTILVIFEIRFFSIFLIS